MEIVYILIAVFISWVLYMFYKTHKELEKAKEIHKLNNNLSTVKRLRDQLERKVKQLESQRNVIDELKNERESFIIPNDFIKVDKELLFNNRSLIPNTIICRIDLWNDIYILSSVYDEFLKELSRVEFDKKQRVDKLLDEAQNGTEYFLKAEDRNNLREEADHD